MQYMQCNAMPTLVVYNESFMSALYFLKTLHHPPSQCNYRTICIAVIKWYDDDHL